MFYRLFYLIFLLALHNFAWGQELRGHGGPVRALTMLDNHRLISSSFDATTLLWDLKTGRTLRLFSAHKSAVNAQILLDNKNFITGGEDGQVAFWSMQSPTPTKILPLHEAPITAFALSPDKTLLASASFDGRIGLYNLKTGATRYLNEAKGNLNGVIFTPHELLAISYDGYLYSYDLKDFQLKEKRSFGVALNAIYAHSEFIFIGTSQGDLLILNANKQLQKQLSVQSTPLLSLGVSPDGSRLAVSGIRGSVTLIDLKSHKKLFALEGPGLPVWSLTFRNQDELITGGADRLIRRWDMKTGEHLGAVLLQTPPIQKGDEKDYGAQMFKACIACHTLSPHEGVRAGPSLHGIIGRRVGTLKDYAFSDALKKASVIWSKDTIAKLFEVGPNTYLAGTKMPEQTINNTQDRAALVDYIEKMTK